MNKERIYIEKAEFWTSNGVHVLWTKEENKWNVTLYKHSYDAITIIDTKQRPSLYNSCYLANKKMKENGRK